MKIYEKLAMIQKELKAPKNQYNSFGKYSYRSCEDIVEAAKPLCIKHGAVLVISDEIVNLGDRYYVKATAILYDAADGEMVFNNAYAREEETKKGMDGSQITGTASSYARKYALNGLLAIDDTKDADTDSFTGATRTTTAVKHEQGSDDYIPFSDTSAYEPNNDCSCAICKAKVSPKVAQFSRSRFNKVLCFNCQKEA